ncbi:MAG TPA: WD40 repeat domain-containing protein [Verrucomicrobiae bacterium]|nr:WD40 repeat domain-containing protein [Verrucomicrobiae bacterium]
MKSHSTIWLNGLVAIILGLAPALRAQGAPDIVWEAITPSGLANSIRGVDWSPAAAGAVVFGSTDRWLRTRRAETGALSYSVLQPHRSGGVDQAIYSLDGGFIAVHNTSGGLDYRVHRAVDGVFLGLLAVTLDAQGLIHFVPDPQLLSAAGGDGTLSRWRVDQFTVIFTVGSGYDRTNTTFNFSPDGSLQSAASQGTIVIRRRSDGVSMRVLSGGLARGTTPVAFSRDSKGLAAWSENPSRVTLWRVADGIALMTFAADAAEGINAIRFTPDGAHLVTTGYLPFLDAAGLWQQKGVIRFWRVVDGVLREFYDAHTGLGVTSPVAWSLDAMQFAYGTYEGTAVVARTPSSILADRTGAGGGDGDPNLELLANGDVVLRLVGKPGAVYHVEAATNLSVWREAGVSTADSNGYCEFLDTNANRPSFKFYRTWRSP